MVWGQGLWLGWQFNCRPNSGFTIYLLIAIIAYSGSTSAMVVSRS